MMRAALRDFVRALVEVIEEIVRLVADVLLGRHLASRE